MIVGSFANILFFNQICKKSEKSDNFFKFWQIQKIATEVNKFD